MTSREQDQGIRVINHSRRYSVVIYTITGHTLLLPGFMYIGGDALALDCVDPEDPESLIANNEER
jgi:hypothetical protein